MRSLVNIQLGLGWLLGLGTGGVRAVRQMTATDCGPACLAMALDSVGIRRTLSEVRRVVGSSRDGTSALTLVRAAPAFGARARGLSVPVADAKYLPAGSIIHWKGKHFVVYVRSVLGGHQILDPSLGRRTVRSNEFEESFGGVAILLENDLPDSGAGRYVGAPGTGARFRGAIRKHSRVVFQLVLISLLAQIVALVVPALTAVLIDSAVPRQDWSLFWTVVAGSAAVVMFSTLCQVVRAKILLFLRVRLDEEMSVQFVEHMLSLPYQFFHLRSGGDLAMRLESNAMLRELLANATLSVLLDSFLIVVFLVAMLLSVPLLGVVVLVVGLLQVCVVVVSARKQMALLGENLVAQAEAGSFAVEMIGGIETLKSLGQESYALERWRGHFCDVLNATVRRGDVSALIEAATTALRGASPVVVTLAGVALVVEGQISVGVLVAFQALAGGFLSPLEKLVAAGQDVQLAHSYIERMDDVFEEDRERRVAARSEESIEGAVELEDVSFSYGGGKGLVLRDISIAIQPGEFVAVVGRSGSGKSTLAKVVGLLLVPTSGRIVLDGRDSASLDPVAVRAQIGFVGQEPYLFSGTISENVKFGKGDATGEEVENACVRAGLAHDVRKMPMGLETAVGEKGAALSGGQRQRVALARIFVRNSRLLVLDEATSALDSVSESKIQAVVEASRATRIVVAHRLSTVLNADRVLYMEDGRIAAEGTHDELLGTCAGYTELVARQLVS